MKPTCFSKTNTFKYNFIKHVCFAFGEPFGAYHSFKTKTLL